ncbi:hypothetical protein UC8_21800 [Roseimaritima ulvae]|uniref:Uncharacterized protein n=2 Tax=Roseimaritima ulvae TaxID=980254 RepID=A0A5B9QML3_9BACT|nr:hypothetical protein UC8_21800 [Roseimaritima ulvae]
MDEFDAEIAFNPNSKPYRDRYIEKLNSVDLSGCDAKFTSQADDYIAATEQMLNMLDSVPANRMEKFTMQITGQSSDLSQQFHSLLEHCTEEFEELAAMVEEG